MNKLYIKSPRQKRAVAALLEQAIAVKDLGAIIGALNSRQVIAELRRQGFEGIIETRRFSVIDRDGKKCRPGEYFIPEASKPMAKKALIENVVQARGRRSEATKNPNTAHNNRRS